MSLNLPAGFSPSTNPVVAGFQQRALAYLAARAAPWLDTLDQNVYFLGLDAYLRPAHLLAVRWNRQRFVGSNQDKLGPQNALEHTGDSISHTDVLNSSLTSTISSSLVNVARFSYIRSVEAEGTNSPNPEANVFESGQLVLTIGRNSAAPAAQKINHGQWDALSLLRGRHSFKVGGEALLDRIVFFNHLNFSGSYRFNSLESFGRSLAGMPTPIPGEFFRQAFSGFGTPGIEVHPNAWQLGAFLQDEWRVRRQLTLNLGLRYDLQAIMKPTVRNPSPALAAAGLDTSTLPTDRKNFAPRIGLAWAPLTSNRLVVPAAYGLFYAPTIPLFYSRAFFQNGLTAQTDTFSAGTLAAALIPSYPNTICGLPDPSGISPSCAAPPGNLSPPILMLFPRDFVQADVQQGTVGLEYQLAQDLAVSLSYLAVKGSHLPRVRDVNLALPETPATIFIAGTTTFFNYQQFTLRRPIADFDRILQMESAGSSIYHGFAVQVRKRFSHNFELSGAYTLSKVIDDNPEPIAVNPGLSDSFMLSDAANPRADRGPGVNDQRHRFVLSGVRELAYAGGLRPLPRAILNGWQLSGIFTAQTGLPYSGMLNFDLNNDGNPANDRTPGLGRDIFYVPSSVSFDPRVTREFHLSERARLAFVWEAFNLFNHGNVTTVQNIQFGRSTSTAGCGIAPAPCLVPLNSGTNAFSTPTATSGPRIMQLSAKLVF